MEVARLKRLTAEAIQQVHQQQLLMLLFVLETQLHELKTGVIGCFKQLLEPVIHPRAPAQDLRSGWPTEQSTLWSGVTITDAVVIGIELIGPAGITGLVPLEMGLQQECLKKPVGVSQMPLRWTGIRHSLQAQILQFQGIDQLLTAMTHLQQGVQLQDQVQRLPRTLSELSYATASLRSSDEIRGL